MFRMLTATAMLTASLFLNGCSSSPVDPVTIAQADYGPYPTGYQETVKGYFQAALKDPMSAQYRWIKEPYKAYWRDIPITGGKPMAFGYMVDVGVNAKNEFGGYTGERQYHMFITNGKALPTNPNPWFDEPWYQE